MTVTFVKKVLASGEPCQKCRDVEARLRDGGHWPKIDRVVIADEADPNSEGMQLAARFAVERAPFFVVEQDGKTTVYQVYLKFLKEHLQAATTKDSAEDLLRTHAELGYL
jgi:hypothetical protein